MWPALFLMTVTLSAMAAIELHTKSFAVLLLLACVVAGLTTPERRGHAGGTRRGPHDEPAQPDHEIDDKTRDNHVTTTMRIRKPSALAG
jgi:hypothetical protein